MPRAGRPRLDGHRALLVGPVPRQRALIVIDHGSRLDAANALVAAVAARVRERRPGDIVVHAHMELASPSLEEAVATCRAQGAQEIVVVPYFLGPGRHTGETIPSQVAALVARYPDLELRIAEPLGADDRLVDVLLERAGAAENN